MWKLSLANRNHINLNIRKRSRTLSKSYISLLPYIKLRRLDTCETYSEVKVKKEQKGTNSPAVIEKKHLSAANSTRCFLNLL